jgi:hypothetical protein
MRIHPGWGIVLVLLAAVGLFALCGDNDNEVDDEVGIAWIADHEWDYGWGDDHGGYDERNGGYGDRRGGDGRFGGGRSGDYDGGPGDDCRNACGNTIIVPTPGGGGEQR